MRLTPKKVIKHIFIYLFLLVVAASAHAYFILSKAYFNETCCDSLKQISFLYPFLHRQFTQGNFFWSWEYGLGGDVFGQFLYYYSTSPFFWLTFILFKITTLTDIIEIKLYISIFKLFVSMVFMYHLLAYLKRSSLAALLGSLIYGGAVYYTFYSLRYDFMVDGMVWLPLLLLGFEKYVQERKKTLFVFSVFLVVCSNFYLAFMNSIFLGLYAILKYFVLRGPYSFKEFLFYYLKFIGTYLIGFSMAAFAFLPAVYAFLHVDRFYDDTKIPFFFPTAFYQTLPYHLFFTSTHNILIIVLPILVFLLLFYGFFLRHKESKWVFVFFLFLFAMFLLPYSYSLFNGFSTIQYRWLYLFVFTTAYACAFIMDEIINEQHRKKVLLYFGLIWTLLFFAIKCKKEFIGLYAYQSDLYMLGLAGIICGLFIFRKVLTRPLFSTLLVSAVFTNILWVNYSMFQTFLKDPVKLKNAQEKLLHTSGYGLEEEKEMFNELKEKDPAFYRILWKNVEEFNAPLLYNYRGFSTYNSLLSGDIHRFFKKEFNTLQYNTPSLFSNVDNRIYIETALSNKYSIVSKDDPFRPYGYDLIGKKGNFFIYQNRNTLPLGFMYDSFIDLNTFHTLPIAKRDQLLLTAAVVENETTLPLPKFNLNQLKVDIIRPKKENILFENAQLNGNVLTFKENGKLIIKNTISKRPGENLIVFNLKRPDGKEYILNVNEKYFHNFGANEIYNYPKEQMVFTLTYLNENQDIVISISPGTYILDDLSIQFSPYDQYKKLVQEKASQSLQNVTFTEQSVSGEINVQKKGILFLSIPYSEGWKVRVDGSPVKSLKVNTAFLGIPLTEGRHKIEMHYMTPYFMPGTIISLVTLLVYLSYLIWKRRRNT